MKITRILHSSVNVQGNLGATAEFYQDLLGLGRADRPEIMGIDGAWFSVDSAQVHLVDAGHDSAGIDPTGPHACFGVEDLDSAISELDRKGIAYLQAAQGAVIQIWIRDPAGNTIELQQDLAKFPQSSD